MPIDMTANVAAIDGDHLDRATFGDVLLQRELLAMFRKQVGEARWSLPASRGAERVQVAHALKGAARGLGAFALAQCAADIERSPEDDTLLERFTELADEVDGFIAAREG